MQTNRLSLIRRTALLLLLPACLAACGTLEISIEMPTKAPEDLGTAEIVSTAGPTSAQMQDWTPTPTPLAPDPWTGQPAYTPVPASEYPVPSGLLIAFVQDDQLWLWEAETGEARALADTARTNGEVRISDDGNVIAFLKDNDLWAVDRDGKNERLLLRSDDLVPIQPEGPGLSINRLEWVPGTHTLAFNTRANLAFGLALSDDLHLVDADTSELKTLLPPGEGGEFYYSPDGRHVAIVTPGEISLIDADGASRRSRALTYTPVHTGSEYQFYAQPAWAPDGSALRLLIPSTNALSWPSEHTTIWHIPTDGSPAQMLTSIDAAPLVSADALAFSPNLEFVAYPQIRQPEGADPEQAENWLEILRITTGDRQAYPYANTLVRWAPDSRRFAFLTDRYESQLYIGQWSGKTVRGSVDPGTPVYDVRWVDAEHYLFPYRRTTGDQETWNLVLADLHGSSTILASTDSYPSLDFALVSPAVQTKPGSTPAPDITSTPARRLPTPTPVASLPGLVYWEEDGLWLDLGGEQVRISDRADVHLSPDGARFVYQDQSEDSSDIWLGDRITPRRQNLTNTAERIESVPRWWPARPNTIVFGSQLRESQEGPSAGAFLSVVNLDGSGYRVLDEENPVGCTPAPSPDGVTIAYGSGRTAWLFRLGTGPVVFDPTDYGLDLEGELTLTSPAWSPDGSKVAWVLTGNLAGDNHLRHGVGIFDLRAGTVELLGAFRFAGAGHCPPPPKWSPDGRWLAYELWAESFDETGLWVVPVEGTVQNAFHLGGGQPVWSPDAQWLAFRDRDSAHWLVQPGSWQPLALDLPPEVDLVDWIDT